MLWVRSIAGFGAIVTDLCGCVMQQANIAAEAAEAATAASIALFCSSFKPCLLLFERDFVSEISYLVCLWAFANVVFIIQFVDQIQSVLFSVNP